MDALKKEEYKGFTIEIHPDEFSDSPRHDDNVGTMICGHRRYNIGDKHDYQVEGSLEELVHAISLRENDKIVYMLIRMYDHSSQSFKAYKPNEDPSYPFDCQWDSGWVGLIYVTHRKLKKEMQVKYLTKKRIEQAYGILNAEIEHYNMWWNNDVYSYNVVDSEGESIDSCSGFYGNDEEYMMSEARHAIDYHLSRQPVTV